MFRFGAGAALVAMGALGTYATRNLGVARRYGSSIRKVVDRGFVERRFSVAGRCINYAEGPDNGPKLLLIHGQLTEWEDYVDVLPALAERFHVFAVDCYGHGESARTPGRYSAAAIGADLAKFIDGVIGGPAIVAGHSSGGLIAAWLGANAPEFVSGIVFEDPPFFSTELPLAAPTFNDEDLARPAHAFLAQDQVSDFVLWYIERGIMFNPLRSERARRWVADHAARRRRERGSGPLRLWFLPSSLGRIFLAMDRYDPAFGAAFHDGSFQAGFDHATTLAAIRQPTVYIKANGTHDVEGKIFGVPGLLLGATDEDQARRAQALLADGEFVRVDSSHDFHNAHPENFVQIVERFADRVR